MCGIAGILSFNNNSIELNHLKRMTDAIIHRGPDNEGHWISNCKRVGLGHRRLSIIDLTSNSKQPMHYKSRFSIVFNGEIYNYREIKEYLVSKKYIFSSESDTEVLLALYANKGREMVHDLDGMFAFAIWDSLKNELFCARDRFGEKPFYYFIDKNKFVFASEMKALWALGIPKLIKEESIHSFIKNDFKETENYQNQTSFHNINKLCPASTLTIDFERKPNISKYWSLDSVKINEDITFEDATEKYLEIFQESVKYRLRSDVSVGSSLSGGIDSSSIVMMIDKLKPRDQIQKVFSARFENFEKDEGYFIQKLLDNFKTLDSYNTWPEKSSILDFIEKVIYHQEEPFASTSVLAQWKVMKLAKENNVTVLLDGQGADEYLAGYFPEQKIYLTQLFFENKKKYKSQLKSFNLINRNSNYNADYLNSETFKMRLGRLKKTLLQQPIDYMNFKDSLKNRLNSKGFHDLLRYADRNSMAFSREIRLPFLSHKLVEFVMTLPDDFLINDGWSKYIHRKSFDKLIPNEICWRKSKIGFEPPQKRWLNDKKVIEIFNNQKEKYKIKDEIFKNESYNNSFFWRLFLSYFY